MFSAKAPQLSTPNLHSQVDIAERTINSAHSIPHSLGRDGARVAHIKHIIKGNSARRGLVEQGAGTRDGVEAVEGVQVLPDPPDAINHGVVQVEGWVAGRNHEVAAGITAHGEVAAALEIGNNG